MKACERLMTAVASCFIKPEDNIARFLLTTVDIDFETPFDVFLMGCVHCNG